MVATFMSETPTSSLPQKFTSADEQYGVDGATIDEAQVSSLVLLSLFPNLISHLNLI